jgi:hypothetical protein
MREFGSPGCQQRDPRRDKARVTIFARAICGFPPVGSAKPLGALVPIQQRLVRPRIDYPLCGAAENFGSRLSDTLDLLKPSEFGVLRAFNVYGGSVCRPGAEHSGPEIQAW